jgi:hypothetical protein
MLGKITWAALSLLDILGLVVKPAQPRTHDTTPLPNISAILKPKKVTRSRKKHVCTWTDQEVWGAALAALLFGIFIGLIL